jgi:hypothetical protein
MPAAVVQPHGPAAVSKTTSTLTAGAPNSCPQFGAVIPVLCFSERLVAPWQVQFH